MSTQQPEALRRSLYDITGNVADANTVLVNRAELRRLYVENEELKSELRMEQTISFRRQMQQYATQRDELLEFARSVVRYAGSAGDDFLADKARSAIAKAIGDTK